MLSDDSPSKVAEFLLQIKAVELSPGSPFTWSSGMLSPIYCDNRKTLSYPRIRTFIRQKFVERIEKEFGTPEAIAGVATGGIAQGVLVAQEFGIPFAYVRPKPKGHGKENMIEGALDKGRNVVVIEDLVSTGNSSLKAVNALREIECNVKGLAAVFSYGFPGVKDKFKKENCPLITLSDYQTLLQEAEKKNYISEKELQTLQEWRDAPEDWGKSRK